MNEELESELYELDEDEEDYDPQVYDPRPDPRTHPEYWTE